MRLNFKNCQNSLGNSLHRPPKTFILKPRFHGLTVSVEPFQFSPVELVVYEGNYQKTIGHQSGFTLVEIIVSLLIIGVMGVLFSFGLTTLMEGYVFTKGNAETAQKGQVALIRLIKEFSMISGVTVGTSTGLNYTSYKDGVEVGQSISWSGVANDPLYLGVDILVDNVYDFELGYLDSFSGAKNATWSGSTVLIEITLKMSGTENAVSTFQTRIIPRNT